MNVEGQGPGGTDSRACERRGRDLWFLAGATRPCSRTDVLGIGINESCRIAGVSKTTLYCRLTPDDRPCQPKSENRQ